MHEIKQLVSDILRNVINSIYYITFQNILHPPNQLTASPSQAGCLPPLKTTALETIIQNHLLSHVWHKPCPSHPSGLDDTNYICRRVQVMKNLITQLSPSSVYFFALQLQTSSLCWHCSARILMLSEDWERFGRIILKLGTWYVIKLLEVFTCK